MTFQELKEVSLAWAEQNCFKRKVLEAEKIIQSAQKLPGKKYVAFSGGKDSAALLHLLMKFDSEILIYHYYRYKFMPEEFENESIRIAKELGGHNFYIVKGGDTYRKLFGEIIPRLYAKGYRISFIGLRKDESITRRNRINSNRSLSKIKEIWPIQNFDWRDVWAYLFHNNIPIHSAYKKYGPIMGWDHVRFVNFFNPKHDIYGGPNIDGMLLWRLRNKK